MDRLGLSLFRRASLAVRGNRDDRLNVGSANAAGDRRAGADRRAGLSVESAELPAELGLISVKRRPI